MATRRAEVRDLAGPEPLQVSRDTGDTYAAPERPVINNDMGRLAEALSSFSGALADFSRRQQTDQKKQQEDVAKEQAARYMAGHSNTQVAQDYRAGKVPGASIPVVNGAYQAAIGMDVGQQFRSDLERDFGPEGGISLLNPDGTPVNIDQFVADRARGYLDRVPAGTPHGAESFNKSVEATRTWLQGKQQEQMAKRAAEQRNTIVTTGFTNVLRGSDLTGESPEALAEKVRAAKQELQGVSKATWDEMDDALVGVMKTQVQAQNVSPSMARNVLALVDAPRKDVVTGQALPPLSQTPRFANDVALLRNQAKTVLAKDWEKQETDTRVRSAYEAINRGDGSFDLVADEERVNPFTGQPHKFDAATIKDRATVLAAQATRDHVQKQFAGQPAGTVNGQVALAQMEQFVPSGILNKEWQGALTSAVQSAANLPSLTDPAQMQRLQQAANLYTVLRNRSPAYVDKLLGPKERDFYATYNDLRKMGRSSQEALEGAARAIDPSTADGDQVRAEYDKITSATRSLGSTYDANGWFSGSRQVNLGLARTEIERRARLLVRTQGISAEAAIEAVKADIKDTVPAINGIIQFDRSPFLNKGKEPVVAKVLDDAFAQHGDAFRAQGITDPSYLSVRFQNGAYRIISAIDGRDLFSGDSKRIVFTDRDLRQTEKAMSVEQSDAALKKRAEAATSRSAGQDLFKGTPAAPLFDALTDPQLGARIQSGIADFFVAGAKARSTGAPK